MNDDDEENYDYDYENQDNYQLGMPNFSGPNKRKEKVLLIALLRSGQALAQCGQVIENAGVKIENSGDKIKKSGIRKYENGKEKFKAGKEIIPVPALGPAVGIPMCISGISSMILGKMIEAFGGLVKIIGKIVKVLGKIIKFIGNAIASFAQKRLMDIGENINTAVVNAANEQSKNLRKNNNDGLVTGKIPSIGKAIFSSRTVKIIVLILIVVVLFWLLYIVLDVHNKIEEGSEIAGNTTNVPYVVSTYIMDKMAIAKDETSGSYTYGFKNQNGEIVDLDKAIDETLVLLTKNNANSREYFGDNDEDRKKLLKKMIMAEIATQYPDLTYSKDLGLASEKLQMSNNSSDSSKDYCVDITASGAVQKCDEEQLKQIINNTNKVSDEGKKNMLDVLTDIVKYQDEYNVNAVFFLAVIQQESSWGTNWNSINSSSYNWASIKKQDGTWAEYSNFNEATKYWFELISGSSYFGNGRNTVSKIANVYCNDGNWYKEIPKRMEELYSVVNITPTGTSTSSNGVGETGNEKISENMNADNKINGGVKIQRKLESGTTIDLTYTSTENFEALLASNSDDIINYYTLQKNAQSTASGSSSGAEDFSGSNNAEIIWNFLKSKGLSDISTAAIIGNLMAESGLNTGLEELTARIDKGYGLAQWTFGRRTQLNTYAQTANKPVSDIQVQLQFLWMEIDPNADHTYANLQWGGGGYGWSNQEEIYRQFTSMTNLDDATALFCWSHERPNAAYAHLDNRKSYAKQVYDLYAGKTTAASSSNTDGSSDSTEKLETSDTKTNTTDDSAKISSFDKFLFIGDSRYEGISDKLKSLGNNVTVCSAVGSSPKEWIEVARNGSGTVKGKAQTLPETATNISIMLGVNNPSETAQMEQLLNSLHSRYSNCKVFVNSVYNVGSAYSGGVTNDSIKKYNDEIRNFCNQNEWAQYVDVTNGLNDNSGMLKSDLSSDGLHITSDSGKYMLVNNIKSAISGSTSSDGTTTTSIATSSTPGYSIVVANKTNTTTNVIESYSYKGTNYTDVGHSSYSDTSKRWSNPGSGPKSSNSTSSYSSTSVAYQDALKNYTLYFNFLWSILVDTKDTSLISDWAELVCNNTGENSKIIVTVYSDKDVSTAQSENTRTSSMTNNNGGVIVSDYYDVTDTIITTVTTVTSKIAVTSADTWLVKYENNADNYEEYTSKSKEKITEKVDKDSEEDNPVKILCKYDVTLSTLKREKDIVKEMLNSSERTSFMVDIFDYIIKATSGKNQKETLSELLDVSSFNLNSFIPKDNINSNGVSGEGASGGNEGSDAGDGYKTTFSVGTRVYKNFKQSDGSWKNTYVRGWESGSNMANSGCGLTSIAVIATGYGLNVTPGDVAALVNGGQYSYGQLEQILSHYIGKSCNWQYSNINENIINQLKAGKPTMVHTTYYSSGHFLCVLAISDDGSQVYVSDVGGYYEGRNRNGWQPISFLGRFDRCMLIGD